MVFLKKISNPLGFYSSLAVSVVTLVTFTIAIFTPPLSGPFCVSGCYQYPYLDIASRFPRDYYWMFPAAFIMIAYAVWMSCLHRFAKDDKKTFSQIGLSFALISTAVFLADYFMQLSVVQPSLLNGEYDGISLLSQFNPHGIFIVLEELGYLLMAIAFLFMAPIFSKKGSEGWLRRLFFTGSILTFVLFLFFLIKYGMYREYRFEVASITINWLILIISGILAARVFKKA